MGPFVLALEVSEVMGTISVEKQERRGRERRAEQLGVGKNTTLSGAAPSPSHEDIVPACSGPAAVLLGERVCACGRLGENS